MCQFCFEFSKKEKGGRVIMQMEGWLLIPTIGCFSPGYSLLMPQKHINSVAESANHVLLPHITSASRSLVEAVFGPAIIAEHGSGSSCSGASCCSHAHLHIIPVADPASVVNAYKKTGGKPRELQEIGELDALSGDPYIYLSPDEDTHMVWSHENFPRQYVRKICAKLAGCPEYWDWREYRYEENMAITIERLKEEIQYDAACQELL